jgi:F0F1-type ATP synthase delta subunit
MSLSRNLAHIIVEKGVSIKNVENVLRTYKLLPLLSLVLLNVKRLASDQSARDTIVIESPFSLNEKAIGRVKRIVGNDIAEHTVTINKDVLSGFKARFKGKLYDGSAERIIKQLITSRK